MTLWMGETWKCEACDAVNAVIRKRCRFCSEDRDEQAQALYQHVRNAWDVLAFDPDTMPVELMREAVKTAKAETDAFLNEWTQWRNRNTAKQ